MSPFKKEVYIRLTGDETGFLYTVKYGWLRSAVRLFRRFETREIPLGIEAPVATSQDETLSRQLKLRK